MRTVIGVGCTASDKQGAWTCAVCGFRGFWSGGLHCVEDAAPAPGLEREIQVDIYQAQGDLARAWRRMHEAGYGDQILMALKEARAAVDAVERMLR